MFAFYDMMKSATATTGTGTVTLGAAPTPYRAYFGLAQDGDLLRNFIVDGSDWERSYGVYDAGANTVTRVLEASSTGSLLNLSGSATVENVIGSQDISNIGLRYIGTFTSSAAPTLIISDFLSASYDDYEILLTGYTATNNSSIRIGFSTDGGSTWVSGIVDNGSVFNNSPSANGDQVNNQDVFTIWPNARDTADYLQSARLTFFGLNGSRFKRGISLSSMSNTTYLMLKYDCSCHIRTTSPINALKLYDPADGAAVWTITAKVYGYSK